MTEYTVVLLYNWSKHGDDIKKMFHDNKLKWNSTKIKTLKNEDLIIECEKFKVINDFKFDITMTGSSGIYENASNDISIKIIKIKDFDNMLIVYKGIEERFYIELMKKFMNIGCLIMKIVDDEIIFKNRINVNLIKSLNDNDGEKNVKIGNFIEKTKLIGTGVFSDDFKNQWINYIKNN